MGVNIHPTALVDPGAELGENVEVGAYSLIGADVKLGDNTKIQSHVVIEGHTTIGKDCEIFSFAAIGKSPQHLLYEGEASTLVIGDGNVFREYVSIHRGAAVGSMTTIIGDNNFLLAYSHVAHDCVLGNNIIIASGSLIGGHAEIGDHVYMGANSGIKQYVRVGAQAMIGATSGVLSDVIPFGTVIGGQAFLAGLNVIGMKRRGYSKAEINQLKTVYKYLFFGEGVFSDRLEEAESLYGDQKAAQQVFQFIRDGGTKSLCHPEKNS